MRRTGRAVTARPMAGTGLRADDLVRSEKDAREHQLVVDAVVDALATACDDVLAHARRARRAHRSHAPGHDDHRPRPRPRDIGGRSRARAAPDARGRGHASQRPRSRRSRGSSRRRATCYAGPCGWVDARGDGEFVVALRGAQIDGDRARLHAGAGIVAGSRADAEWAETQVKLEPMLRALVRI